MQTGHVPLRQSLEAGFDGFTAVERKVAQLVLAEYPYGALVPIQDLARRAGVSAPSITRFVAKLGCSGFSNFQRRLINELKERALSPVDLRGRDVGPAEGHFLPAYVARVAALVERMADGTSLPQFDALCDLLADARIRLHIIGGRITNSLAHLLAAHLEQIRCKVRRLPTDPEEWPTAVASLSRRDAVIVFDIRRYDPRLAVLAEQAAARGATVIAITDQWLSPVSLHARLTFPLPIDVGTAWDTHVALVALVEALVVRVSERDWPGSIRRIAEIDKLRATFDPLRRA